MNMYDGPKAAMIAGRSANKQGITKSNCPMDYRTHANLREHWFNGWDLEEKENGYTCPELDRAMEISESMISVCQSIIKRVKNPCPGFEIEEGTGDYSGCNQSGGDCPVCGK